MVSKSANRIALFVVAALAFGLFGAAQSGSGKAAPGGQAPAPPPTVPLPPPEGDPALAGGGQVGFIGIEGNLAGKVVAGAPYSAQAVTERTQVLADGNRIDQKSTASVYRDGQGRTRREQTPGAMGPWGTMKNAPPLVFINDPVAGVGYVLNPQDHTAVKHAFQAGKGLRARMLGRRKNGLGRLKAENSDNVTTESLGKQTLQGLEVEGTRTTVTIPAGTIGNAQPIQIVTEKWYSPALQVVVSMKRDDPRSGETTYQLTGISQTEPAASLFQVPSDYKVTDRPKAFRPAPPPPPPGE